MQRRPCIWLTCRRDEDWDENFCAALWRLVLEPASWPGGRAQRLEQVLSAVLAAPEAVTDILFAPLDGRAVDFLISQASVDGSVATSILTAVYRQRLDLRPTIRGRLGEV